MNYLNREQRRNMILQAAKEIALQDGLSALTVRQICAKAGVSTGQVHHHFKSSSHLKAQVFVELMDQLNEIEADIKSASSFERLCLLLGLENIEQSQPYLRLWNEAEILIDQDEQMKKAYNLTMERWHAALVEAIQQGIKTHDFKPKYSSSSEDIAWRLIAFVCGLEGIYPLELKGLDKSSFKHHVEIMIKMELLE